MTAHPPISLDSTVVRSSEQASADLGDEAAILNRRFEGVFAVVLVYGACLGPKSSLGQLTVAAPRSAALGLICGPRLVVER
ncbi:MAG: hypothetical protein ABSC87_03855 [Halobacteriota archaeon]|jgi:hypothetical protein